MIPPQENGGSHAVEVIILDRASIVNIPGTTTTFCEYAMSVFLPYVKSELQRESGVDVVID